MQSVAEAYPPSRRKGRAQGIAPRGARTGSERVAFAHAAEGDSLHDAAAEARPPRVRSPSARESGPQPMLVDGSWTNLKSAASSTSAPCSSAQTTRVSGCAGVPGPTWASRWGTPRNGIGSTRIEAGRPRPRRSTVARVGCCYAARLGNDAHTVLDPRDWAVTPHSRLRSETSSSPRPLVPASMARTWRPAAMPVRPGTSSWT